MDKDKQQLWQSKKHLIYLITLISMVAMVYLDAPEGVTSKLADAIALGLPILLAGQSWIDRTKEAAKANSATVTATVQGSVPPS